MPSPIDKIRLTRAQDRRAKVTEEQCEEMRALYGEGIPQYVIAKKYGISQSAVSYIVSPKAHENLRKYRQINPPKRRTKEEARIYHRNLRNYKRQFYKAKKSSEVLKGFKVYKFKKRSEKDG